VRAVPRRTSEELLSLFVRVRDRGGGIDDDVRVYEIDQLFDEAYESALSGNNAALAAVRDAASERDVFVFYAAGHGTMAACGADPTRGDRRGRAGPAVRRRGATARPWHLYRRPPSSRGCAAPEEARP